MVGWAEDLVLGDTQHAGGGAVVLWHLRFPIGQASPGTRFPYSLRRREQSAGISNGAAADGTAMKNGGVPEEPHVEEATQAEFGTPEPAMDRPTGARQRLGSPAPAHFHDTNFVTFFRQAMR